MAAAPAWISISILQDISSLDFLEFDFYIDNVAALKQEKDFGELFIRLFSEAPSEGLAVIL